MHETDLAGTSLPSQVPPPGDPSGPGAETVSRLGGRAADPSRGSALRLSSSWFAHAVRRPLTTPGTAFVALTTVAVAAWTAMPSNDRLWSFIVGNEESGVFIAEDRSCATVTELYGDTDSQLVIDGASQNNHPFDDFHILVGLVPSLAHPDPGSGLAIGFGVGSTTTALLDDARLDRVVTAELCGGAYELARRVAADRAPDLAAALADPRSDLQVTDGRHLLLTTDERFDVITVDTLRPTSSNAGSHVSVEFYELVDSRLTNDGVFSQWITSARQVHAAAQVFPYLRIVSVANYNSSLFMNIGTTVESVARSLLNHSGLKIITNNLNVASIFAGREEFEVTIAGGTVRQRVSLQQGIPQEKAKEIVKFIKDTKIKVQASIQGDLVRVAGKDRDALQAVIAALRGQDFGIDMQFGNYRSN